MTVSLFRFLYTTRTFLLVLCKLCYWQCYECVRIEEVNHGNYVIKGGCISDANMDGAVDGGCDIWMDELWCGW